MVWLYWHTKNPKHLEIAKRIAELNRQHGSVSWMIRGDKAPSHAYEDFHIHAALDHHSRLPLVVCRHRRPKLSRRRRGRLRPRLRKGHLGHGRRAGTDSVGKDVDPHDETCQTSDELQLSYLLGEFTGEGRFFDRGELIYYNHIRYMQMHNGDFSGFNKLPARARRRPAGAAAVGGAARRCTKPHDISMPPRPQPSMSTASCPPPLS